MMLTHYNHYDSGMKHYCVGNIGNATKDKLSIESATLEPAVYQLVRAIRPQVSLLSILHNELKKLYNFI